MRQNIIREFIIGKRGSPREKIVAITGLSAQQSAFKRDPWAPVRTRGAPELSANAQTHNRRAEIGVGFVVARPTYPGAA